MAAPARFGVEVILGQIGSGKSLMCVKRVLEVIARERRPVYTNLPIRFPAMRAYLRRRYGAAVAGLIHELDERHWRAFLDRAQQFRRFDAELKRFRSEGRRPLTEAELDALEQHAAEKGLPFRRRELESGAKLSEAQRRVLWLRHAGPDIKTGPQANWIPARACIVIDEVQEWHPMEDQKADGQILSAYLSKVRHHEHLVWVVSQDEMKISIQFRRGATLFWWVWDASKDPLIGPFTVGMLFPLQWLRYACWTKSDWPNAAMGAPPVDRFSLFPGLMGRRPGRDPLLFRLYDSVTNAGGSRVRSAEVLEERLAAGLDEKGRTPEEIERERRERERLAEDPVMSRKTLVGRLAGVLFRGLRGLAVVVFCFLAGWLLRAQLDKEPKDVEAQVAELPRLSWPKWSGMGGRGMLVDGQWVPEGGRLPNGAEVRRVERGARAAVLLAHDRVYVWKFGESEPRELGPVADVERAIRSSLGAAAGGSGVAGEGGAS